MRIFVVILIIAIQSYAHAKGALLIDDVSIVSSHLDKPLEKQKVLIVDDRIKLISDGDVELTSDVQVIDGRELYLTPGIMDSHVHVSSIPGMGFGVEPVARKNPDIAKNYYRQQPHSFLYHGVTQVLDPNPGANWIHFTSPMLHPKFFRCEVVTSKNSFPMVEKKDPISSSMFRYIVEESVLPNAENSPEKIVEQIAQSGASCVKIYFEDGYGDASHWPLLTDDTLDRIRLTAKTNSLPVIAHANALDMYINAIDADVDVIAHGLWNWGAFSRKQDIPQPIIDVLDQLMRKKIAYMPSQRVIAGLGELMQESSNTVSEFNAVTTPDLIKWYDQSEADWFKEELRVGFDGLPDQIIARIFLEDRVSKGEKVIQALSRAGYPLLLGSDFPGSPSQANQPGYTTYLEMKALKKAGLSLTDILASATINNAMQFNLDDDYGTVEVGKIANLLLLRKNPLHEIEAWNSIDSIILNGIIYKRETFSANSVANKAMQR